MTLGGPAVAPTSRTWVGVARELTAGTALLPTNTIPQEARSLAPEDTPKFLPDESIRGSMAMRFSNILGPENATFSFGGPAFLDTHGYLLDNLFGDLSTTGSTPANGASLNGGLAVGGTNAVLTGGTVSTYPSGAAVQINAGSISEVVVLSAAWTGGTITFSGYPLRFAHSTGATVNTVASPYTHTFALLNSALGYGGVTGAQPPTHSLTDNTVLNFAGSPGTNTSGARTYPFACVSAFDMTLNAEQLLNVKITGNSFLSAPAASAPSNTISAAIPAAAWQGTVYIGGTAAGNQVSTISELAINAKRKLQTIWTAQGLANPLTIARGDLDISGTMQFASPQDESPLYYMLNNTQPVLYVVLDNGLSGAAHLKVTFRCSQASFTKAKPGRNQVILDFADSWEAVANATDTGGSGGLGPGTFTLVNQIPAY